MPNENQAGRAVSTMVLVRNCILTVLASCSQIAHLYRETGSSTRRISAGETGFSEAWRDASPLAI
jgi:hypothetical protein